MRSNPADASQQEHTMIVDISALRMFAERAAEKPDFSYGMAAKRFRKEATPENILCVLNMLDDAQKALARTVATLATIVPPVSVGDSRTDVDKNSRSHDSAVLTTIGSTA